MKVGELKKLLEKYDDNLEVLGRDNDYWYYSHEAVRIRSINEGRIVVEGGEDCLCLE